MIELELVGSLPVARNKVKDVLDVACLYMMGSIRQNFDAQGRPNKWPAPKSEPFMPVRRGTQLKRSEDLYNSGSYKVVGTEGIISWGAGLPYAWIQNFGGKTHPVVSAKMKKFFWWLYILSNGEEELWMYMALKPIGEVLDITIPAHIYMMFQDEDIDYIKNLFLNYSIEFEGVSSQIGTTLSPISQGVR